MRLPGPVYIYIGLYKINSFYNCKRAFESISANLKQNMKLESYVIFFLNKKRRNLTDILDLNPFLLKTRRTFVHIYKVVQIYSDFFSGGFYWTFQCLHDISQDCQNLPLGEGGDFALARHRLHVFSNKRDNKMSFETNKQYLL